jgi:transcriptional regulator
MYIPRSFEETDQDLVRAFLRQRGFATLVSIDGNRPVATHLLLESRTLDDGRLALCGHMARANPQWETFREASEVLAIFQGPHSYVSAAWYSVPSAPTWNYTSVHAYGVPRIIEDRGELFALLKRLVDSQEGRYPSGERYTIESLSDDILLRMMNGIVGFEIVVSRTEAAAKMSQNRSEKDYQNIIDKLNAQEDTGSRAVAAEMERRKGRGRADRP